MTRSSDLVMVERELDQPSIATKQATDETAASVLSEALDDVSSVYDEMCIQFSGVHADDRMDSLMLRLHSALKAFGREQVGTICAHEDGCPPFGGPCPSCEPRYQYSALAQLTKTPSADHDDGNLRSLAEPTPRDSSESTTGGAAPDHTTMEARA